MRSAISILPVQADTNRFIHHTPNLLRNGLAGSGMLILLACLCASAHAQTGEWTWVGGSNTVTCDPNSTSFCTVPPVFGTVGTPATTNVPGGLYQASSWTDSNGNFWLFGGSGSWPDELSGDPNPLVPDTLNDLWEFNPSTKQWTWMAGADTGWLCNLPYSVSFQGCSYAGTYGVLGSLTPGAISGSRYNAVTWSDQNNNLWLFGGVASVQGPEGWSEDVFSTPLNDLWEFNPSTGEWGWMSGSETVQVCSSLTGAYICPMPGVYGTMGVAAAGQFPGARVLGATWTDSTGNLWMFGGAGWDGGNGGLTYGFPPPAAGSGLLNDLWQFNPNTLLWTWMGGANLIGGTSGYDCLGVGGVYGQQGVPATGNWPGGREDAATWTDPSGNFWLFGGSGVVPSSENYCGTLNDLWKFNASTNLWTWVSGTSATTNPDGYLTPIGVYGTLGIPGAANVPGARTNAVTWVNARGKLWLFGGNGVDSAGTGGNLNDLWRFDPSTTEWTWMGGSKTTPWGSNGNPGIYGTLGTPAAANSPGGRTQASGWTDGSGNFWLFGGSGTANGAIIFGSEGALLNDLWEYQPSPVSLTALSLSFGNQLLGTTSASQSVTMTNVGIAALPINSISVTGAGASSFLFTNTCATSLAVGANCTISGHFAPTATGAMTATVTITDSAGNSPQTIALSGTGVAPAPATLTSPASGSTLTGSIATFTWSAGTGVTQYDLHVGTTGAGSSNIFGGTVTGQTRTMSGIPTTGATLNVRLYSLISGAWQYIDYTFTEATPAVPASMISPAPSSTLASSTVAFSWTAGTQVTQYDLHIGTTGVGSSNIFAGMVTGQTKTITGIPTTGGTLNVRLYSLINGAWQYIDYTYTEANPAAPATLSSPTPGSALTGSSATFTWTTGTQVTQYDLHIGTTGVGSSNIFAGTVTGTSKAITGIPTTGGTLNVRLYSLIAGAWQYNDYTYTESIPASPATMSSPTPGSALTGSSATFTWTAGSQVTQYDLHIGTTGVGSSNIFAGTVTGTSKAITGIPTTGGTLNVRHYSLIAGAWQYNDYTYTEQ